MRRQGPFEAANEVPANRFGDPKASDLRGKALEARPRSRWRRRTSVLSATRGPNGCGILL